MEQWGGRDSSPEPRGPRASVSLETGRPLATAMTETALLDAVPSPDAAADQDAAWLALAQGPLSHRDLPFEEHWAAYCKVFAHRRPEDGPPVAWRPTEEGVAAANVTALRDEVGLGSYAELHAWSVASREAFWTRALERLEVPFRKAPERVLDDSAGAEHAVWLKGAALNAAELCFQTPEDRVAIVAGREGGRAPRKWTYGDLKRLADRVSHGLREHNLRVGDAVALYMPMTPECVAAYLGIVQAGLAVVSIPDSFAPEEVSTRLRLGGAKALVTVTSFQRGGKSVPVAPRALEASEMTPGAPACIVIGDVSKVDLRYHDLAWEDFLGPEEPFEPVACAPDAATNVLFSSGTTGEPKAIPWTHATPLKAAVDGHLHQDIHPEDVVAWPTNIGWMMGPWLLYASLGNRAAMALWEGAPVGEEFLDFLDAANVTVLGVVPAMVRSWRQAGVAPHRLPKVRVYSSTGEASNPHDYLYLMSLSGYRAPVVEYCGGTEVGGGHLTGTVVQDASPATFTTPTLGIDFVLLDDEGKLVEVPGMGELFLLPPSLGLSQTLLNRDHHEEYYAGVPRGPNGETLRRHGDEVERLPGGYYRAQGRADDTMNLGGIKVGSVELETVMNGDERVSETAAVAVPPEGGGADRLVVFAVPAAGKKPTPAELRPALQERLRKHLNPLFRIHDVVVVKQLPRTASNKVMRRELRSRYK